VAFRTPEGHRVLVLVNTQKADRTVRVREGRYETSVSVPAEGLVTMRWK
jgi:O-glycosyl hydrolase